MQVYTIASGTVTNKARVVTITLTSGIKIPAIEVGENGRGRKLAYLPVELTYSSQKEWEEKGGVSIDWATLGKTVKGSPKIIEGGAETEEYLVVFRTKIGFRGGNRHTGDRIATSDPEKTEYLPFPGHILAEGTIAAGDAGKMGAGSQYIAIVPKGVVFRTQYSGRLYGEPSSHYYVFPTASQLLVATWKERLISDLF